MAGIGRGPKTVSNSDVIKSIFGKETGSIGRTQADDIPDDVAKLAFGGDEPVKPNLDSLRQELGSALEAQSKEPTAENAARVKAAQQAYQGSNTDASVMRPDAPYDQYIRTQTQVPSLGHIDDASLKQMYQDARKSAAMAQDKIDSTISGAELIDAPKPELVIGSYQKKLMQALDDSRKFGTELYSRTQGQEGMAPRLKRFVDNFMDETGAIGRKSNPNEPSDLEKALQQSQDLMASNPEAAKVLFKTKAEQVVRESKTADAERAKPFIERARSAKAYAEDIKAKLTGGEQGSINNPKLSPGDESSLNYEHSQLAGTLGDLFNAGNADEVTRTLKRMKAIEDELAGGQVTHQTLPPEQRGLPGVGPTTTPQAGAQTSFTPANQQSFMSAPPHWQGASPAPTTPEAWAEFLRSTATQPEFKDALKYQGVTPDKMSPDQWAEFLRSTGTQPKLQDALTHYGVTAEEITPQQWAEYLRTTGKQPGLENAVPELGQQAGDISPEKMAMFRKSAGLQTPLNEAIPLPGAQIPTMTLEEARDSLNTARFWGRLEKFGIRPEDFSGGGLPPETPNYSGGDFGGGNTKPPSSGQGQFGFGDDFAPGGQGSYKPDAPEGSMLGNIARSIVGIPGDLIGLKASLTPPLLRQGKVRVVTAPVQAMKEFYKSLQGMVSEEAATKIQQTLLSDDWVRGGSASDAGASPFRGYTWQDAGGHVLDLGDRPEDREVGSLTKSWLSKKIQNSWGVKLSDRQAVLQLNLNRMNWYKEVASKMYAAGEDDPNEYVRLRKLIEHTTQRGDWGQQQIPLFFSVRAQTGRVQGAWDVLTMTSKGILDGSITDQGPARQAAKVLVNMTAANMTMMGTMAALGLGTVSLTNGLPTLRDGAFHLDPWAGWGGQAKVILGIGKDIKHSYMQGENSGWEDVPQDFAQRVGQRAVYYAGTQLSPAFSTGKAAITGKDFTSHDYNLAKDFKSGNLLATLGAPIIAEELARAYKTGGVGGAAESAVPTLLSEGTGSYRTLTEMRNDAAKLGTLTDANGKTVKANTYSDAGPLGQYAIDQDPTIAKFIQENPTPYKKALEENVSTNPFIQEASRAETQFERSQPIGKNLRDYWSDETNARLTLSKSLQNQFKQQFSNFDPTKYETAVQGYFDISKKDDNNNPDFESTDAARQSYVNGLPPDEKQWVQEALQVSNEKKTPLHKEYLDFLDQKEAKGYFTEGISGSQRAALDRKNPDLDYKSWKFSSDVEGKAGNALQSLPAVQKALESPYKFPVKFAGAARPVNESEKSLAAWKTQSNILDLYSTAGSPQLKDAVTAAFTQGQITSYNKLPKELQSRVDDRVRNQVASDPAVQAMLVWWGIRDKPTPESLPTLTELIRQYGPLLPPKKEAVIP